MKNNSEDSKLKDKTPFNRNDNGEIYGEYKIINQIYFTKSGELLLVSNNNECKDDKLYLLNKIEIINNEHKSKIEKEIDIIKQIDSKYVVKIIKHFAIIKEKKEYFCIILNYYKSNLKNLIYNTNFLNNKNNWKFFVQIIFGLNSLNLKGILPNYLFPESIYIDEENNIKIGGIGISLDLANKNIQEIDLLSYTSPEIIKGEKNDEKSIIWSIGCTLYELVFKKIVFENKSYKELEQAILQINYNLSYDKEKEFGLLIQKLICEKEKRATIKEVIFDETFKNKIIEINLFTEIVNPNIQGK